MIPLKGSRRKNRRTKKPEARKQLPDLLDWTIQNLEFIRRIREMRRKGKGRDAGKH